jgi:ribosomal protein S18 acetylase RimI-like enzyme
MTKLLTESVLRRLTGESLVTYLGHAEPFESGMHPGVSSTLTGEPVADLNYVVRGRGANDSGHFGAACTACVSRDCPSSPSSFRRPGAASSGRPRSWGSSTPSTSRSWFATTRGSSRKGTTRSRCGGPSGPKEPTPTRGFSAQRSASPWSRRAGRLPAPLLDAPNLDVFLAFVGDDVVGTVTVIHQGDTCGIWSMATDSTRQRSGIGRWLLSTAMAETRVQRARRFFLGATPAGYRLYESLGFTTRGVAKVWASGETHQA